MRAEIVSIGTELLVGSILNTNARYLSQKLAENGIDVYLQSTVGDNIQRISQTLARASVESDIIICSGGLGPTEDDVTTRAVSDFLKRPLELHSPTYKHIEKRLSERGYKMTTLIKSQCYLPKDCHVFTNIQGTAPGTVCEFDHLNKKRWLIVLPGPPRELQPLFEEMLPVVLKKSGVKQNSFVIRTVRIAGLLETDVAKKIPDLLKSKPPLTVGIYAKPGEVELKIMSKSRSRTSALKRVTQTQNKIKKIFGNKIYGYDAGSLASTVGELLRKRNKTLCVAESCTGGLVSSMITDVPGSSAYFLGGIISYDNRIKTQELGISQDSLKMHGAVSRQIAAAMAKAVRAKFVSDYSIAITGIAGPHGATPNKPVGLVYIALSGPKTVVFSEHHFFGKRADIKLRAAQKALDLLRLELIK